MIEQRDVLEQLAEAVKWWNADEAEEPDVRRLFTACKTEIERLRSVAPYAENASGLLRRIVAGWHQSGSAEVWAADALQEAADLVEQERRAAALAKNPNPSGHIDNEALPAHSGDADPAVTNRASGPVGLGPCNHEFVTCDSGDWCKRCGLPRDECSPAQCIAQEVAPVELGCPGHLIVADKCRWKRHTQVGAFRVSTIGNYFPDKYGERETIGGGREDFFETMVFPLTDRQDEGNEGCGCRAIASLDNLECERYSTPGAAQIGHEQMVQKYLAIARGSHEGCLPR